MTYVVALILVLVGSLFTLWLLYGWNKISQTYLPSSHQASTKLSILIAARNEEKNMPELIRCLSEQNYPRELLEIILIDDHSEDATYMKAQQLGRHYELPIKVVAAIAEGKKAAIQQALTLAQGSLIVLTDADCRMGKNWLAVIEYYYRKENVKMICGPVFFQEEKSWRTSLLSLEFASLIGSGASTLQLGMPTMCNGANIAYEKEAFEEVGGYVNDGLASGDDEFLMHKIFKMYPTKVKFIKAQEALITTYAPSSWKEFFNQRRRWASKWEKYTLWYTKAIALLVVMVNGSMLISCLGMVANAISPFVFCIVIGIKIFTEFLFLQSVFVYFGRKADIRTIAIAQLLYPFYVLFFGVIGRIGKYRWKGRIVR